MADWDHDTSCRLTGRFLYGAEVVPVGSCVSIILFPILHSAGEYSFGHVLTDYEVLGVGTAEHIFFLGGLGYIDDVYEITKTDVNTVSNHILLS